jgi:hypothetical protein
MVSRFYAWANRHRVGWEVDAFTPRKKSKEWKNVGLSSMAMEGSRCEMRIEGLRIGN